MLRTNEKQLIMTAVQGAITFPGAGSWRPSHDGRALMLPGVGGLTYNLKVGDSAFGWVADHAEPCVSSTSGLDKSNTAYNYFACIGNEVRVLSGEAKGAKGVVTGTHGGCEHVMIDFADDVVDVLTHEDKLQIRAVGQGLELLDYPEVKCWSVAPHLLQLLRLENDPTEGKLRIPVSAIVPAELLGSGLGHTDTYKADIDIQTSDADVVRELGLDKLRLGDIVALMDYKGYYGWAYQKGAVMIGVVCHTDSYTAGHGPGVTTILFSETGKLAPIIYPDANIGQYLKIGRFRPDRD